jgi:hypothetical protein
MTKSFPDVTTVHEEDYSFFIASITTKKYLINVSLHEDSKIKVFYMSSRKVTNLTKSINPMSSSNLVTTYYELPEDKSVADQVIETVFSRGSLEEVEVILNLFCKKK